MTTSDAKEDSAIGSLARGLAILALFDIGNPQMSFAEILQASNLPKTTVHRLLKALVQLEFLGFDTFNKKYFPGPRVMTLGFAAVNVLGLVDKARPLMEQICRKVNQTVGLSIRDKLDIVIAHRVLPVHNMVNVNLPVGSRVSMHNSGAGRLHLAFAEPDGPEGSLLDQIAATMTDESELASLRTHVAFARAHAFSFNDEEVASGFRAVTVPVWKTGDTIAACIHLAGPSHQLTMGNLIQIAIPELTRASAELSMMLGASRKFIAAHEPKVDSIFKVLA